MENQDKGTVIKSTGSWYQVALENSDKVINARIRGKFRLEGRKLTNPVAVGDVVELEIDPREGTGLITKISERKNFVVRQSPRRKHNLHLLAANIDLALLIVTIVNPKLKQGFIDRFLLLTEPRDIPVLICFNKSDLYNEEDMLIAEYLCGLYKSIGYDAMIVSAIEKTGVGELAEKIQGKTTLVSGQSGVGKSTLLNALKPGLNLKTADLSGYTGKGQHTTTFAELYQLDESTRIIDTPGIKTLSYNNLEVMDVAHNFREFFEYSQYCKFGNCTHRNEPGCAVKQALEEEEISELRYANYIAILDEIEQQNHWERHRDY
ncbi:MAG: ribosome small subunit-dependent GTPase A [Saprospirales bacterium]|nr:MAG: ribosome small subunit-dependent GTPase A [Saprospirales bacterium]